MADHYKTTYYVLDPTGVVHRVKTESIGDLRALDSFRRQCLVHGYTAKGEAEVAHAVAEKIHEQIFPSGTIKHDIQNAFLEANGTMVDHAAPKAFFDAIGYVGTLRNRCKARHRKMLKDELQPDGSFAFVDPAPYHVELPGLSSAPRH
jgi:hypothetical protein